MKTTKADFDKLTDQEKTDHYDLVSEEFNKCLSVIAKKTGYYCTGEFSIYAEPLKKCMNVQLDIALIEKRHSTNEDKVTWYEKVNPDNCLNEPIFAHKHNSWYKIWDGNHRLEANERLGKKKITARIIVPDPQSMK